MVVLEADTYRDVIPVLKDFSTKQDVKNLYFNVEYPINELERDRDFYTLFKENNIGVFAYHDQVVHEPGSLKTQTGVISRFIVLLKENGLQSFWISN